MPLPYDAILADIREFCDKTRAKYDIMGGFSPDLEDNGKDAMYVTLSFIHEDFYKKRNLKQPDNE